MATSCVWERLEPLYQPFIKSFSDLTEFVDLEWPDTETEYPPNLKKTLLFFVQTMVSRARAAFMLLQAGSYWESEIVLRSLLEAAVRCATFARRNNAERLLHEYWIDLQASSDRKSAIKAKLAQAFLPLNSTDQPIFDALQNPEWFSVDPVENKQQRRRLDQQWSLPELVKKLQDPSATIEPIIGMDSMFHSYGLQSEIFHVSSKYYDLLWDRTLRTNDLFALENTHYCRQLTDAIQLTSFCVMLGLQRLGAPLNKLKIPIEIANNFSRLTETYKEEFDQSQGFA